MPLLLYKALDLLLSRLRQPSASIRIPACMAGFRVSSWRWALSHHQSSQGTGMSCCRCPGFVYPSISAQEPLPYQVSLFMEALMAYCRSLEVALQGMRSEIAMAILSSHHWISAFMARSVLSCCSRDPYLERKGPRAVERRDEHAYCV